MKLSPLIYVYPFCASCFVSAFAFTAGSFDGNIGQATCPRKISELHQASLDEAICTLAIDNEPSSSIQSPWTHSPSCINAADEEYRGKFCVYTASFFGDHGLSLVTKPETAANIVGTIMNTYHSSFPSPQTVVGLGKLSAYDVVDMPGRGKGVIATRLIKRHETFMVDYAVLIIDVDFPVSTGEIRRRQLLRQATEQLANPIGATSLARSRGNDVEDLVEDVMGTNSFITEIHENQHNALFPIISRMNHACAPK
jgi:hypothetical protein